jgi:hypothetical protein
MHGRRNTIVSGGQRRTRNTYGSMNGRRRAQFRIVLEDSAMR